MEKNQEILMAALKQAGADSAEQRLYKAGKLPGLFASRTGLAGEIAASALEKGFLEIVRTESKGKTQTEWVKITQKGIEYLIQFESPLRVVEELRQFIQLNQEGIPVWVEEFRSKLNAVTQSLAEEVQALRQRLETVSRRAEEVLERLALPPLPEDIEKTQPWAMGAVRYLEERRAAGVSRACPLPELFAVVREQQGELTLRDFHAGLRKLHDRGWIELLPFEDSAGPPQPEYALLDGLRTYFFAALNPQGLPEKK